MAGKNQRYSVTATTDASGAATVYLPSGSAATVPGAPVNRMIFAVVYEKTDFAAGVDFTITTSEGGINVWTEENVNASKTVYPSAPATAQDGTARLFAGGGTAVPIGPMPLANEVLKIVIASGGDTKTGAFTLIAF